MRTGSILEIGETGRAGALLESFLWSSETVPTSARRITSVNQLTHSLQRIAHVGDNGENVWTALAEGNRMWLVLAIPAPELALRCERLVLELRVLDESAVVTETATYADTRNAGWQKLS